jgi:murein DD-endopeptidase MepM/ murein hydrolase activator NlpD
LVIRRSLGLAAAAALTANGSCSDAAQTSQAQSSASPSLKALAPAIPSYVVPKAADAGDFALAGELTQGGWLVGTAPAGARSVSLNGEVLALDAAGHFFAAFDRDAGGSASLSARMADGRTVTRPLSITPRAWDIERIAIGPRPGSAPSLEYLRRRSLELDQINAARRIHADCDGWRQRFIWPLRGRLSGRFGSQRIYRGIPGGYHSGNDISVGPGGTGTPYVAPADGVVILAASSPFTLEGNLLMIDHGMGLNSAFLHSSKLLVKAGDRVKQGQVIGLIGMTGRATGPHLHWSLKWGAARLDSLLFTGAMR